MQRVALARDLLLGRGLDFARPLGCGFRDGERLLDGERFGVRVAGAALAFPGWR